MNTGISLQASFGKTIPMNSWAGRETNMGLVGKVVAVKAVKGRKEGKEEKKEAEAASTEEKKE